MKRPGVGIRPKKALITVAIFGSIFYPSYAFTGRPQVIDDAFPVSAGHVELELGLVHAQPRKGGREQRFPVIGLTFGLVESLEVGLSIQRNHSDLKGEPPVDGFEDLHLTAKYLLLREWVYFPALAFGLDLKLPTADRFKGLSTGRVDESLLVIASKNLTSLLAFDLNLGYGIVNSPPDKKLKNRFLGGFALQWSVLERWVLLGEVFGLGRKAREEKNEANFQVGLRYTLAPPIMIDAALGRSLRAAGPSVQTTFGFTWTFGPIF
ncbi:MAG: transporter [Deltaproteobacteria bacterium]|nr:transporter [Deltaproteobacteria bacterium]